MALPLRYNARNLRRRFWGTLLTLGGIALVVVVVTLIFAVLEGLDTVLTTSGHPRTLLVTRDGSQSETQSYFELETAALVKTFPGIALWRDPVAGPQPLASAERIVLVNFPRRSGAASNVLVRGVTPAGFALRDRLRIVEGRMFRTGLPEVIVSRRVAQRFLGCGPGDSLHMAGMDWPVVGVFDAGGTATDSEIWTDSEVLGSAFDRKDYVSSVLVRAEDEPSVSVLGDLLRSDKRIHAKVQREPEYWASQTAETTSRIRIPGMLIALLMAFGATFGAMNTMYASVSARTREIGTLRAIGFRPGAVLASFLLESVLLAVVGAGIGLVPAIFFNGMESGTTNFQTFSEITFSFRVTPAVAGVALLVGAGMGVLGGFVPALRAARMRITDALRAI